MPAWVNANAAIWLDYDRDGWLDLFLAGYWPEDVDLWHLKTTRIMPESFEYAENGGRKYLFRNRGDGTFEETSAALGIQSRRWTLAAAAADLLGHRLSRICSSPTTTASPSSTPTRAASSSWRSAGDAASAARRRAA